ncbi:MAG: transposase [Cytophagales bacterium]|nr:transposase [Cytophagales bacterium]
MDYQFVPCQRLARLFKDCFSLPISEGTLANFTAKAYKNLSPFEEQLKERLLESAVIHADETAMRSEGKRHWMHVAGNDQLTYYHFDPKEALRPLNEQVSSLATREPSSMTAFLLIGAMPTDMSYAMPIS